MSNSIYPCLWFNGTAAEAAELYCSIFPNAQLVQQNPMVTLWQCGGQTFMGLNGGEQFAPNPSISFMVTCTTTEEAETYWNALLPGGNVLMPLDAYPWSERYGWLSDRFGVSWQIYSGNPAESGGKIVPSLLFCREQNGKAEAALQYYTNLFPDSSISGIHRENGLVQHAQFTLNGHTMMAMDGGTEHAFSFTEGVSLVVNCDTQEQIDHYWDNLTQGGEESMCGWLKDKFGVSWQIVPALLGEWMSDAQQGQRVMKAVLQMRKLDIATLMNA